MPTQARTERGDFVFKVSEFGDGTPWIITEPRRRTMPVLDDAFIGFDLPPGTTHQRAREIADFMNKNLVGISMTIFDTHPMFKLSKAG